MTPTLLERSAALPDGQLHFLGIGGIGMSGLAGVCLERGYQVSGCDAKLNGVTHRLQERGAALRMGHAPDHLDCQTVIYSSAVSADEPELREARARGLRVLTRGELLAALADGRQLVGVAGAHGKTTTSGMASQLLLEAGWDPTVVVGGIMLSLGANARHGRGTYMVAETDESDGSFLHLMPTIAIITNIDREHLNYYQTFERLIHAFERFAAQIRPGGLLIRCTDDPIIRQCLHAPGMIGYGFQPGADVTAEQISLHGQGSRFRARYNGRDLGAFQLQVPGRHNILNALGVISLGLGLDLPLTTIRDGLAAFQGTRRRFEVVHLPRDIRFIEDYAHHPSEIRATLAADTRAASHRLVVFQPHRFTRTQSLERELTACFDGADGVIVTDIYGAFEPPIPGISGERLATLIRKHGHPCVRYVPKPELRSYVGCVAQPGDTIFFLGAGDIGDLCHDVAAQLRAAPRAAR